MKKNKKCFMNLTFYKNELAQCNFGGIRKPLAFRPAKVLALLQKCLDDKIVLNEFVLQDWYMDNFLKTSHRYESVHENGTWVKKTEYEVWEIEIKQRGGLVANYRLSSPKCLLKYHIGNLVVNGYLAAIPIIKIEEV